MIRKGQQEVSTMSKYGSTMLGRLWKGPDLSIGSRALWDGFAAGFSCPSCRGFNFSYGWSDIYGQSNTEQHPRYGRYTGLGSGRSVTKIYVENFDSVSLAWQSVGEAMQSALAE